MHAFEKNWMHASFLNEHEQLHSIKFVLHTPENQEREFFLFNENNEKGYEGTHMDPHLDPLSCLARIPKKTLHR